MDNKKGVTVGIISGIALLGVIVAIALVPVLNHKKDTTSVTSKSSQILKSSSDKSSKHLVASTSEQSTVEASSEASDALQHEVEVNPDGKTGTDRRTTKEGTTESTSVSEKDIETAGQTGEHSDKVFDVKVKDGTTVSEEDIANARKTLKDAGINDGVYSDLDIAKVIKAASDKSLDIVTVAKDGKF